MKTPTASAPDSSLNMTPMIDIVFQLILFFLLNLRFKTLDFRLENQLPKNWGPNFGPPIDPTPHLRATLVRLDPDAPLRSRTKLRLAGQEWVLPDVARPDDPAREATFRAIESRMSALHASLGAAGEIDCPAPTGTLIPHGDVIRVLDAFITAGMTQVDFQGARAPLPGPRP